MIDIFHVFEEMSLRRGIQLGLPEGKIKIHGSKKQRGRFWFPVHHSYPTLIENTPSLDVHWTCHKYTFSKMTLEVPLVPSD